MASRGEITEPKEGSRRSGSRRWQQRGWKQHRAPCRDPRHATVTLKRRIQRHVLVDTAADRYDARHLQVIISVILSPSPPSLLFLLPHTFHHAWYMCVCVCVYVGGKEKGERERERSELVEWKKKLSFFLSLSEEPMWRFRNTIFVAGR